MPTKTNVETKPIVSQKVLLGIILGLSAGFLATGAYLIATNTQQVVKTTATNVTFPLNYAWSHNIGGTDYDQAESVAVDNDGNTYVAGEFRGSVDFDPGNGIDQRTSAGADDVFVTKFSRQGDYQWTVQTGAVGIDYAHDIAVDSTGNVYVVGRFNGNNNLIKLDASGIKQYEVEVKAGEARAVVTDFSGNLFIGGSYGNDSSVTKVSIADGSEIWTYRYGQQGYDWTEDLALDSLGRVIFAGRISSYIDFPNSKTTSAVRDYQTFTGRLTSGGDLDWVRVTSGTGLHYFFDLAVDGNDNVYQVGLFDKQIYFDLSSDQGLLTATGTDGFLTKINEDGTYGWTYAYDAVPYGVEIDTAGNILIAGDFSGSVDFNPGTVVDTRTSNGSSLFISKLTTAGAYLGTVIGGESLTSGSGIRSAKRIVFRDNALFIVGFHYGQHDLKPGDQQAVLNTVGTLDGFVVRYNGEKPKTTNDPRELIPDQVQ